MLLPALVLLLALFGYPIIYTIDLSVRNVNLFNIQHGGSPFVGLENYIQVMSDPTIWNAFYVTILFFGVSQSFTCAWHGPGACFQIAGFFGKSVLMTVCLIPMMVTPITVVCSGA